MELRAKFYGIEKEDRMTTTTLEYNDRITVDLVHLGGGVIKAWINHDGVTVDSIEGWDFDSLLRRRWFREFIVVGCEYAGDGELPPIPWRKILSA